MKKLQPVRGTKDLLFDEMRLFQHVTDNARAVSARFGFSEIATPIFEFTDVFKRTLGDTSDVVSKEMYSLEDRGGESLTLRPEFTAGIARAFISNGLAQHVPVKFFSTGPVFRYERPQKGRQRQFHQVNFEILGADQPQADIEAISLGFLLLKELGLAEHVTLEINSLGDDESRRNYREALVAYLQQYTDDLSEDSQTRLQVNPMRILDSKNEGDRAIVANAPKLADYYNETSQVFFDTVLAGLDALGIAYKINPKLVRGLDYYSHTAFEFTTDKLGAQSAVLAGGRYNGLIGMMGGTDTPAVGFAGGVERLMLLSENTPKAPAPIALIPIGETAEKEAQRLAYTLREAGFVIEYAFTGNLKKRMKKAGNHNAAAAIIFGEDELTSHQFVVKDFTTGQEEKIPAAALMDALQRFR
jgi:histidyl-tRNA synthetase